MKQAENDKLKLNIKNKKRFATRRLFGVLACAAAVVMLPVVGVRLVGDSPLAPLVPGILFNVFNLIVMVPCYYYCMEPILKAPEPKKYQLFSSFGDNHEWEAIGVLLVGALVLFMPALTLWLLLALSPHVVNIVSTGWVAAVLSGGVLIVVEELSYRLFDWIWPLPSKQAPPVPGDESMGPSAGV